MRKLLLTPALRVVHAKKDVRIVEADQPTGALQVGRLSYSRPEEFGVVILMRKIGVLDLDLVGSDRARVTDVDGIEVRGDDREWKNRDEAASAFLVAAFGCRDARVFQKAVVLVWHGGIDESRVPWSVARISPLPPCQLSRRKAACRSGG